MISHLKASLLRLKCIARSAAKQRRTDFRMLTECSPDVICLMSPDSVLQYVSQSATSILGRNPGAMLGNRLDSFIVIEDIPEVSAWLGRLAYGSATWEQAILRACRPDGTLIWLESRARWSDRAADAGGTIVVMRDVTEGMRRERELNALARTDSLTGLSNRRALNEQLERACVSAGQGMPISLLMADVDSFKLYNDQFGHQAGDECLFGVAAALQGAAGTLGITARYGGEEFAALLVGSEYSAATDLADRFRGCVEELQIFHPRTEPGCVTVSVGVASLGSSPHTPVDAASLIALADRALYNAKKNGRNCVARADELSNHPPNIMAVAHGLRGQNAALAV